MKAFLPIKDHSERVPGKNFKQLGSKSLFMWILETLLSVEEISTVVIDTDSTNQQLWSMASDSRIQIKTRNPNLIGDFVSMNELIWDFIDNKPGEEFLMTHATNPFLSTSTIKIAIEVYNEKKLSGFDSLFSVSEIQGRLYDSKGRTVNHKKGELMRTQDLEKYYLENSALYLFSHTSFAESRSRIGHQPYLYRISPLEAIDIDTRDEWALAEKLALTY